MIFFGKDREGQGEARRDRGALEGVVERREAGELKGDAGRAGKKPKGLIFLRRYFGRDGQGPVAFQKKKHTRYYALCQSALPPALRTYATSLVCIERCLTGDSCHKRSTNKEKAGNIHFTDKNRNEQRDKLLISCNELRCPRKSRLFHEALRIG